MGGGERRKGGIVTEHDGAACYLCLGDEADEEAMPLVRDCSCRGDSAGFAHLDCLIKYAEQKSKGASILGAFDEPWRVCNNCTQLFQNQLSTDMASAFVSFAEATYGHPGNSKWDRLKIMSALQLKINALNGSKGITNGSDKLESTIDHLLSIIDRTKKDLKINSWVHKPKTSEEYQYYKMICGEYEAYAHMQIAMTFNLTEEKTSYRSLQKGPCHL